MSTNRWRFAACLVLFVALVVRVMHADTPVIGMHSWRQSDTAAIARNFAREGMNIALPRIDWRGSSPGFVQTEFPIYPWTSAWLHVWFGEWHGWCRIVTALVSTLGVLFMMRLAALTDGRAAGLIAGVIMACAPLNIYYGRAIMPDTWMLTASAGAIYCFARWSISSGRPASDCWLVPGVGLLALACLCKLPALYLGLPVAFLLWLRLRGGLLTDARVWLCFAGTLIPVLIWYTHAYELYKISGLSFGLAEQEKWLTSRTFSFDYWWGMLMRRLASRILTWPLAVLFVVALVRIRRQTMVQRVYDLWLIALLVYLAIVAEGNRLHEYYQLPLLLPCSVLIARAAYVAWMSDIRRRLFVAPSRGLLARIDASQRRRAMIISACFLAAGVLAVLRMREYRTLEDPSRSDEYATAVALARATQPGDRVVIMNPRQLENPTLLYNADRKGWTTRLFSIDELPAQLTRFPGAKAIAGAASSFNGELEKAQFQRFAAHPMNRADPQHGFVIPLE